MSMTSTMSNALSGLAAAARAADLISSNVANALTEGYGRRTLELSSSSMSGSGSGVQIDGVTRSIDQGVLADRRMADAALARTVVSSKFYSDLEAAIGTPDQPYSLNGRLAGFGSALISAASRPDSDARLDAVLHAASGLTDQIRDISKEIQSQRTDADRQIDRDVTTINDALKRIETLNHDIAVFKFEGKDASALLDQRQLQVDRVSPILAFREVSRENGQIALYTPKGAMLVDGKASEFGFSPAGLVSPNMFRDTGGLSGLTLNDRPIETNGENSSIEGGSLSAHFAVRDETAVAAQAELDAIARDLVERFQNPPADPTLGLADAGLFTDGGVRFDPANETGLSSRMKVNSLVDPSEGGTLWRLRDGLKAPSFGPVGDATILQSLSSALNERRVPLSGSFTSTGKTSSGLAADFLSSVGVHRTTAQADETYASAHRDSLNSLELQGGVDTDQEMSQLLLIEQAYTANAKVIQTVDGLIQALMRI